MKKIDQTKIHSPDKGINGNCLAASLASILELPLLEVPEFEDMMGEHDWFEALKEWLEKLGFTLLAWQDETWLPGYYLATGISERGINHTVVYKGGKLVHDPHPSRSGIKKVKEIWALLPVDPSQYNQPLEPTRKAERLS